ncbi:MAG: DUF3108 domain-containing protein [Candidatus Thiodiazotropha sp.]
MPTLRSLRNWRLALGLLLLGLSLTATAAPFFKPFSARFSVSRGSFRLGDLEVKLSLAAPDTYLYHAKTIPGLLARLFTGDEIIEESSGRLTPKAVIPQHYSLHQKGNEAEQTEIAFDWRDDEAQTTSEGVTWSQQIVAGTQDRLSQQLMVRLHLAQGFKDMNYPVADGGKIKRYRFQVVGEESVKTPYGNLRCLKVQRSKMKRPPDYTIWFAPDLDYLPVRIERKQKSGTYRMSLEKLDGI